MIDWQDTMTTIRQSMTVVIWIALTLQVTIISNHICDGFTQLLSKQHPLLGSLFATLGEDNFQSEGTIQRSQKKKKEANILYDYLGANPKDTQEQLRIRYTTLARSLHPDSNPNKDYLSEYYNLSEINAAWEVLKDPKERKRYDRSLQAKEISDGIESMVSLGIKTAIPWLKKTVDTTAAAVDISTKAAQIGTEQARTAYGDFGLKQERKALEQKAKTDDTRISLLEKELSVLPTQKNTSLEKRQQQQLSSMEAQRMLKSFQLTNEPSKPPSSLLNEINVLYDTESKYKDAKKTQQLTEQATRMAARKVDSALRAEEMAQKRLEDSQRALKEAKTDYATAQGVQKSAKAEQRLAQQSMTKFKTNLQKIQEKVRIGLLQQQDYFMAKKAKELKTEMAKCKKSSKTLRSEAEKSRMKAEAVGKKQ